MQFQSPHRDGPQKDGREEEAPEAEFNMLWAVVKVVSGIPTAVELYRGKKEAEKRERFLRRRMHPENDETGIFEITLPREEV